VDFEAQIDAYLDGTYTTMFSPPASAHDTTETVGPPHHSGRHDVSHFAGLQEGNRERTLGDDRRDADRFHTSLVAGPHVRGIRSAHLLSTAREDDLHSEREYDKRWDGVGRFSVGG
jgi:hypothetical protein